MFAFRTHRKLTEICKESGRYYLISGKFTPIENEKLIRQINQLDVVQDGLHIVPLSRQVVTLLRELKELTGHEKCLFPVQGTKAGTMPLATLRNAVNKMGFKDRFNPHGARGTFSTILNEKGYRPDIIERQLAHAEKNAVRAAYHHAEYLPERKAMMQDWANMLDTFQSGAKVIQLGKAA